MSLTAAALPTDRGWLYSEQYRHECEVRYVCNMPTRAARAAYLDGIKTTRAAPLRAAVQALWRQRHPTSPEAESPPHAPAVHPAEQPPPHPMPGFGSFPSLPHEDHSTPSKTVDSEGRA